MNVDHRRRLRVGEAQRLGLCVAAVQHLVGDCSVISDQQGVALLLGQLAVGHERVEQDLDVDLVVGAVDPGDVVDRVGVDPAARRSAYSIRPRWVNPRLPPSPTTLQRSSSPSTRTASLALSPTSRVGLAGAFT